MENDMYYVTINNGMDELIKVEIKGDEKMIAFERPNGSIQLLTLSNVLRAIDEDMERSEEYRKKV